MNKPQDTLESVVHANQDPITSEGGAAGHAAWEALDPAVEIAYWRSAYVTRPYYRKDRNFEDLEPAYRYGLQQAVDAKAEQRFEDVESELERTWPIARGNSLNEWKEARDAARDSWIRIRGQ